MLFGDGEKCYLGKLLDPFVRSLARGPITYLDVSSQLMGDAGNINCSDSHKKKLSHPIKYTRSMIQNQTYSLKNKQCIRSQTIETYLLKIKRLGAAAIAALISDSTTLQTVVLDDNHITVAGFTKIRDAMEKNTSVCNMPYPKRDVRRACVASKTNAKKLHAVLMEIKVFLKRNRKRTDISIVWVGEEDEVHSILFFSIVLFDIHLALNLYILYINISIIF